MTPEDFQRLQLYDRIANGLGNVGAKMIAIGNPWLTVPRGPKASGLANDALQRQKLVGAQQDQQRKQQQQTATSQLFGGTDPRTGITWNQGRPGQLSQIAANPATPPEARRASLMNLSQTPSLLAQASPDKAVEAMIAQQFPKPTAEKMPTGMRRKADGGLEYDPAYLAGQERLKLAGRSKTEVNVGNVEQNKAATFASRMLAANDTITQLEDIGSSTLSAGARLLPNFLVPADLQALDTTSRDFAGAILRKESGAAITSEELQDAKKIYIPMPGDSKKNIAIKRGNRLRAIQNMQREGGPALSSLKDVPGIVDPEGGGSGTNSKRYKYNPNTGDLDPQ